MALAANIDQKLQDDTLSIVASGNWTIETVPGFKEIEDISSRVNGLSSLVIDLSKVSKIDTSGAWWFVQLERELIKLKKHINWHGCDGYYQVLLDEVRSHSENQEAAEKEEVTRDIAKTVDYQLIRSFKGIADFFGFIGLTVVTLAKTLIKPSRFRFTSWVHHMDRTGLRAVPIIALISFLIGGIIAQQSAFQLRKFGAELFMIDLVGILVLREIGVLLPSILIAGRSGSAFTAEIGSMKMREEIDAIRTMGVDPIEVLVLPRLMALLVSLPLLSMIGNLMSLSGAGVVAWYYSGISPDLFLSRLRDAIDLQTLFVGMFKAPFMAMIIAITACREGFRVEGSTDSLGAHTTSSVVKAIFLVIVVDGIFAIFFAVLDW